MLTTLAATLSMLFVGDSITQWPDSYAHQLADSHGAVVHAVNGVPTTYWVNRFHLLPDEPAGFTLFFLGVNDFIYGSSPEVYRDQMQWLIDGRWDQGDEWVCVVELPWSPLGENNVIFGAQMERYRDEIRQLDLDCIITLDLVESDYYDNIHPNGAGHAIIREAVLTALPEPAYGAWIVMAALGWLRAARKEGS